MSIQFINGNLLDSNVNYICHQVNCQGRMGSGIAKSIKERWPVVYNNYIAKYNAMKNIADSMAGQYEGGGPTADEMLIGDIQIVGLWEDFYATDFHQSVINMFAQQYYGYDGKRYTSYDGFWSCLGKIRKQIPKGSKIGFPDHIGCGLGGANWEVIKTMIQEALSEDFEVYIYKLEA